MLNMNYHNQKFSAELHDDYSAVIWNSFSNDELTTLAGDYYYHNAASCPDCGAGMVRQGLCFTCPSCGFGGCAN